MMRLITIVRRSFFITIKISQSFLLTQEAFVQEKILINGGPNIKLFCVLTNCISLPSSETESWHTERASISSGGSSRPVVVLYQSPTPTDLTWVDLLASFFETHLERFVFIQLDPRLASAKCSITSQPFAEKICRLVHDN